MRLENHTHTRSSARGLNFFVDQCWLPEPRCFLFLCLGVDKTFFVEKKVEERTDEEYEYDFIF